MKSVRVNVSIPHESVRYFIKRFNGRAVFKDSNVNCPNILNPSTPIGTKIAGLTGIKLRNTAGCIDIDSDEFEQIGCSDLATLLKLCYLEFSLNQDEKDKSNTFTYITGVYKEILSLIN